MTSFYLLPHKAVILLLVLLILTLILESFLFVHERTLFPYHTACGIRRVSKAAFCLYLLVLIDSVSHYLYHLEAGVICFPLNVPLFYAVSGALAGLTFVSKTPKAFWRLLPVFFLLPVAERLFPFLYPAFFLLSEICLFAIALTDALSYRQHYAQTLSAFSLKDAIDGMHFALLLYRGEGRSLGQILLCNQKMHALIVTLTGASPVDGAAFQKALSSGTFKKGVCRETFGALPVFHLPDGSIWQFQEKTLSEKPAFRLIAATDITDVFRATRNLQESQKELEERRMELESLLLNLKSICQREALLDIKRHVHDLLAHRISLLLRTLSAHRLPDEAALLAFSKSLMAELKKPSVTHDYTFLRLRRDLETLGVALHTQGALPKAPVLRKTLYEIVLEATSNAIRHGYATDISITIKEDPDFYRITIINNGISVSAPIVEGGGLKSMRQKTLELSGTFSYQTKPDFSISVKIPKGEML